MPNLLPATRNFKRKAILLKLETAYGIDATPTGLLNWFEMRSVTFTPMDAETAERNLEMPYMGNSGKILVATWGKISGDILLAGSGTKGTAAKWGAIMPALGFAETVTAGTSVAYNLASSGFGSLTAHINIDTTLHKFVGCRGEIKAKLNAKGAPMLTVELTGIYVAPVGDAMPTIDRSGWAWDQAVNSVNTGKVTLNGIDLAFSTLEWALGNNVTRIDLPGPQRSIDITDRKPTANLTVLATDIGVFDPFALAQAGTVVTLTNTHGQTDGNKIKTDMKVRLVGVDHENIEDRLAYKLTLEPTPVNGNDEIALTCL